MTSVFTIMINDGWDCVTSAKTFIFVDDLKMIHYILTQADADNLQMDLDMVYQLGENKIKVNITKWHVMTLSKSIHFVVTIYYMNKMPIIEEWNK